MQALIKLIAWISIGLLTACATPKVPQSDLTVRDIFAAQEQDSYVPADRALVASDNLAGFARTADTELKQLFPKLPNPTLILYVFPHRSGGLPIPGYTTALRMYPADPFALPGELSEPDESD